MNIQPRTRRERVIYRMAEILADKLAHAHNSEMSSGLLMTASEMQAEDEVPPGPPRTRVEFRMKESNDKLSAQ